MTFTKLDNFGDSGKSLSGNLQNNSTNPHQLTQAAFEQGVLAPANSFSKPAHKEEEKALSNPFPVHVFPLDIQEIIHEAKRTLLFPEDYLGASILFAAGLAVGNSVGIKAKETWTTSSIFYIALVGSAGVNKSHPLKFALEPLLQYDKEAHHRYINELALYEAAEDTNAQSDEKPVQKRLLVSDYTPESLAVLHKDNRRGMGVYADELVGWIKNFDRYSKGNEQEFWLSCWSGATISIDRKNSPPIRITNPFVGVIGTIQPSLLSQLFKDGRQSSGFIDRILFAYPTHLQKEDWCDADLNSVYDESYKKIFASLLNLQLELDLYGGANPTKIEMTSEAQNCYIHWYNKNAARCRNTQDETLKSLYCKFDTHILRFALVLELLQWACDNKEKDFTDEVSSIGNIQLQSIQGAIELGDYFLQCSLMVQDKTQNTSPLDYLDKQKLAIYEELPDEFQSAVGLAVAIKYKMPERTFKRFLSQAQFFVKQKQGLYMKKF